VGKEAVIRFDARRRDRSGSRSAPVTSRPQRQTSRQSQGRPNQQQPQRLTAAALNHDPPGSDHILIV
jgi:hypothetical protein